VLLAFWLADSYLQNNATGFIADVLTKLAPPLAGAFGGATAAFYYSAHKDRQTKHSSEISAGNFAMFRLHEIYSILATFRQHFINPVRQDPERWIKMDSPAVPGMIQPVEFDFEALAFLLNDPRPTSPAPQILSDLLFAQERFRVFTQVVDARTRFLIEAAAARSNITIAPGASAAQALVMATFNSGLQQRLAAVTDDVIERVDESMTEIRNLLSRLRQILLDLHPAGAFIELKFQED